MRVITRKGDKSSFRKSTTSTRAMWKFMLKSINYGPTDGKIYDCSPSFFGLPLNHFSPDDEQLPTPVEDMLLELFRRGPSTDGIFRKSALMKTVKQLKQELEEGKIVSFKDKSAVVIATIFKEFLRGLPSCAFGSEFLQGILETNDIDDHAERVAEINKNLNKLPKLNQILIKKFLCVLYHIARLSETNQMTSQNLAICIAPSLVWSSKAIVPSCAKETTAACEFVMFMIDNYIAIFGEEATTILGDESEIQPPITYEDEDMLDQNSDSADTALKTPEEVRAKKADFTLSLRVPDFNITPDVSPTSPEIDRKCNTAPRVPSGNRYYDLKITNRRHSENDLTDLNDNLPVRKLRAKVPLTSYTATAELIKHQENGHDDSDDSSSTVIRIVSSMKETPQVTNGRRKISPSNHAIYHRKVRPTPTYEEAIRQLRRNAQFSPLFLRKSDDYLESSDDSIDLKSDDKPVDVSQQQNNTQLSNLKNHPISPTLNRFSKTVKPERQKFTYNIGSPTTDRLKTSRYAVEDLRRRSPEQTPSGNSRHPSSPAYEQHLQRRRRFEAAYLQKINLDLNDIERPNGASKSSEYKTRDIDFARSYNGAECEKLTSPSGKGLATSLDSSTLRALRAQAVSGSQNVVPLSNGVHTFITHRRNTNEHIESKAPTSECLPRHSTVSSTVSATPRLMTSYWKEHDRKQTSPLRAAIDVGSFMYRPGETSANGHFTFTDVPQVNGDGHKKQENGIAVMKNESNNNNSTKSNLDRNRAKKSDEKAAEDFDKLISTLKSRTDSSSTNSSESAGNLDVPSHEHIKTILCQDESYV